MRYLKYFIQFLIIIILFLFFKILGYEKGSNLGALIGKIFGKYLRSENIILKNISLINNASKEKINNSNRIVEDVFSNYGRILSDYIYLKNFRNGKLNNRIKVQGIEILEEIKKKGSAKQIFRTFHKILY